MRVLVAWRILTHEVARSVLAVLGVFAAVVLVFLQLGFYGSVPSGSMIIYDALDFDLALASRDYSFQIRPGHFPRRRLFQSLALPEVASATPLYQLYGRWLNVEGRLQRQVFVMGIDPDDKVFLDPAIQDKTPLLKRSDTALVDSLTRAEFGPRSPGTMVEINRRKTEVVGSYDVGTGFLGMGVVLVGDQNFVRLFPKNSFDNVQLGLIRLRPGSDPQVAAERLRAMLPSDTRVFTRAGLGDQERNYWLGSTSTGLVFGFGTVVAGIVGAVILFQTLSTLIIRNLKEYAVLKAMGHTDNYLAGIVLGQAMLLAVVAFGPALAASYALYDLTRDATHLPVYMTGVRIASVFFSTVAMAGLGALLTFRILKRADPVDLF